MPPKKPSPKKLFASLKTHPKKTLGQNFLLDENIARKITDAARITAEDEILEIGPGLGALTRLLCEKARRVIAVEKDPNLIPPLTKALSRLDNVEIVAADALKADFSHYIKGKRLKVVANLPYSISSQILLKLIEHRKLFSLLVLMLQREVGARIASPPGGKTYGSISVFIQAFADVERVMSVPPEAFWPTPEVESIVLRLTPLAEPRTPIPDEDLFRRIVRGSFSSRRKIIANSLGSLFSKERVEEMLESAGIERTRRAETLSVEEFGRLCRTAYETP